jgi:GAF domain-containing protein
MEPIPETRYALTEMSRFNDEDLTARFTTMASRVGAIAADCVGMTLSYLNEGLAFTWAATGRQAAFLDAAQYLGDGPCIRAMDGGTAVATRRSDPLDEDDWHLFARAENTAGVESTLSIPLMEGDRVVGGVNFYGGTRAAFDGLHEQLAEQCGGWAEGATTNADLSLSAAQQAKRAPQVLQDRKLVHQAVGMIMAAHHESPEAARERLRDAAERAGIHDVELARLLVKKPLG